jgi:tRNA nucleotidyltransferase (CCA-adding enzyme)
MEAKPSRMLAVLRDCGALARIMPELDKLWGVPQPPLHHPEIDTGVHVMLVIDYAAERGFELPVRFAALMHDLGKGATPPENWPSHHGHEGLGVRLIEALSKRLKVPNECRELALMTAREHGNVSRAEILRPNTIVTLFERCDAFRKPRRFEQMLLASECDFRGRGGAGVDFRTRPYPQRPYLLAALSAARSVNAGEVAQRYADKPERIRDAVHNARVRAVKALLGSDPARHDGDAESPG